MPASTSAYPNEAATYQYRSAAPKHTHSYLWPVVDQLLSRPTLEPRRIFELGCGNGALAAHLTQQGFEVVGVDPSQQGIALAQENHPHLHVSLGSGYDDLAQRYGRFPCVVSLEVIEHVYAPRKIARALFDLLEPDGFAVISTPYHGYWKNLALALTGKMDQHFTSLWDDGHIKFWSISTLSQLLREAGFRRIEFLRIGRIPPLAKSMVAVCRK